jgi:hypothetical protein
MKVDVQSSDTYVEHCFIRLWVGIIIIIIIIITVIAET